MALGTLVALRLLTGILPPEEYGRFALSMTVVTLAHQAGFGPLSSALSRFFAPAREQDQLLEFAHTWLSMIRSIAIVVAIMAGVGLGILLYTSEQIVALYVALSAVIALTAGVDSNMENVLNAARMRRRVAGVQMARVTLRYGAAYALASSWEATGLAVLVGFASGSIVLVSCQFGTLSRLLNGQGRPTSTENQTQMLARLKAYAWPFSVWGLLVWTQLASDRWALQVFADTSEVGLYNALYQLGHYPVLLLSTAVAQYLTPLLYERVARGGMEEGRNVLQVGIAITAMLGMLGVGFTYLSHNRIADLALGRAYRAGSELLPWFVVAAALFAVGQSLAWRSMAALDSRRLLRPVAISSSIGAGLTFALAYSYGIEGVVAANILYGSLHLALMWRAAAQVIERGTND